MAYDSRLTEKGSMQFITDAFELTSFIRLVIESHLGVIKIRLCSQFDITEFCLFPYSPEKHK